MKPFARLSAVLIVVAAAAGISAGQKKPPRRTAPKKPPVSQTVPPLDVRAAREKTEVQRDNVLRFIDVLGPIAQGIEDIDAQGKTKPLPPATVDKNTENKKKVVAAIRNVRAGLAMLESEYRTKTSLAKYLPTIKGITDLAADSEDMALAGKFVASKEPLRAALQKLNDTLNLLPH